MAAQCTGAGRRALPKDRTGGAKKFWRDILAVVGIWVSVFLLVCGLPWAMVWGNAFKNVCAWTGTAAISQDWTISSTDEHAMHAAHDTEASAHAAHGGASIDTIIASARALNLAAPVIVTPPTAHEPVWWVKSNAQNRPAREDVAVAADTGAELRCDTFGEKHIIDQVIGVGIAAHEGQLFAPLNQVHGVLTALGLVTLCVSAFVMWRRRAPDGLLVAPPPIHYAQIGWGLAALIVVCGLLLPVLGISLLLIGVVEWGVLQRWPSARRWLGMVPT